MLVFAAAVAVIFAAKFGLDRLRSRPFRSLVSHTLTHGKPSPMPPEVATFFDIPNDGKPLEFRKIEAGSHDGRTHSFAVRVRPASGHTDVFLTDSGPNGYGYHYRTSTDGRLIQAVYADTEMRNVEDAKARFATEVTNWLAYLESASSNGD